MNKHFQIAPRKRRKRQNILKVWREQMGYSQREAVKELGCSRRALDGWENDRHEVPRYIALAMSALTVDMPPFGSKPLAATAEE